MSSDKKLRRVKEVSENLTRPENDILQEQLGQRISRRRAIGKAGTAAAAGVAALVVGGAAGYYLRGGGPTSPPAGASTTTVTSTVATTVTRTETTATISSTPTTSKPQATYVALAPYLDVDFYIPIKASVPDAAAMFNVDFKLTGTPGGDVKGFADIFSATIAQKPDGIIIMEFDPSLFPLTKQALSQGIPVVSWIVDDAATVTSPHPSGRLGYIGTDQHTLGTLLANRVLPSIQALNPPKGAPVAIFLHRPGASDLEQRAQGYKDVLDAAGFTTSEHLAGPDTIAQAESLVESYLTANPDVVAAFGCDGVSSPGVGEAISKLSLKGKVIGAGFDLIPENLQAVHDGNLAAIANQQPYVVLPVAVHTLLEYKLSNGLIAPWDSLTGSGVVDQTNISKFWDSKSSKYVGASK